MEKFEASQIQTEILQSLPKEVQEYFVALQTYLVLGTFVIRCILTLKLVNHWRKARRNVFLKALKNYFVQAVKLIHHKFVTLTKPAAASLPIASLNDLTRSKKELIAENALLRQQLIVLNRQVKRLNFRPLDRFFLVLIASWVKNWRQTLFIIQPDTILRWHREGFKLLWKFKSKPTKREPRIHQQTIELIRKRPEKILYGELKGSEERFSSSILAFQNRPFANIRSRFGPFDLLIRTGKPFSITIPKTSGPATFCPL